MVNLKTGGTQSKNSVPMKLVKKISFYDRIQKEALLKLYMPYMHLVAIRCLRMKWKTVQTLALLDSGPSSEHTDLVTCTSLRCASLGEGSCQTFSKIKGKSSKKGRNI